MRNLIGRLNARSQTDLDRIAVAWRMIITAPDKAGTVAQVIRTLTDIRAVRDAWWSLGDDDRSLLAVLAEAREPMSIESIAVATKMNEADTRAAAIRLYRSGWIARDGDNSELRIDEMPRLFVPPELAGYGVELHHDVETGLRDADVVMVLRVQLERLKGALLSSLGEYSRTFGVNRRRLALAKPDALVMHPGPMNRGVEIEPDVADGATSHVLDQVEAGVAIRMALLYLLAGDSGEA